MSWSLRDIPPMEGATALVTGANSGLGRIVARELGAAGALVVLACRDAERGARALEELTVAEPAGSFELLELDLGSLDSVAQAASRFVAAHERLDLLVNNAGVMIPPYRLTEDGFELQLGTNHLGHFALTARVSEALYRSPEPRVVNVSSTAHRTGRINFQDINSEQRYSRWGAYSQSKLANLLFTFELQRRAIDAGWNLVALAAHPGYAATNLQFAGIGLEANPAMETVNRIANRVFAQSDEAGALPLLYAAVSPDAPPGAFIGPDGPFEMRGSPTLVEPIEAARDEIAARRLWELSEELTGIGFLDR
jgi:NAD(P)-dependent dehydrogenase (short-subunit alcohol dehydrogenase family)